MVFVTVEQRAQVGNGLHLFFKETIMKISLPINVTTVTQSIAAVALALLLSKISFGMSFTVAIVAALSTWFCSTSPGFRLAPAGVFWVHTPSYTMLGAAVVMAAFYKLTDFALLAFFSVLLFSTLGGIVAGRWVSTCFPSRTKSEPDSDGTDHLT
jgi:hypothetical protein